MPKKAKNDQKQAKNLYARAFLNPDKPDGKRMPNKIKKKSSAGLPFMQEYIRKPDRDLSRENKNIRPMQTRTWLQARPPSRAAKFALVNCLRSSLIKQSERFGVLN